MGLALSLALVARCAEPKTATAVHACAAELHAALAELRALARGITDTLHGRISVESAPGAGTTVRAAVPATRS